MIEQPSEETIKKMMEFFMKTSVPRILAKRQIEKDATSDKEEVKHGA
ncbi:hypothetical protein [Peribacillus loiseleuriae]